MSLSSWETVDDCCTWDTYDDDMHIERWMTYFYVSFFTLCVVIASALFVAGLDIHVSVRCYIIGLWVVLLMLMLPFPIK